MGKGIEISPFTSDFTFSSSWAEVSAGSANKSPRMIARENDFLVCNFDSFSKTAGNCPFTEPVMMLHISQYSSIQGSNLKSGYKRTVDVFATCGGTLNT